MSEVMMESDSTTSNSGATSTPRALAALVLGGGLLLLASSIADGAWSAEQAPFPYAWRDVALIHVLCALPLALVLAMSIRRRMPTSGSVALAAVLLLLGIVPLFESARPSILSVLLSYPVLGLVIRAAAALGVTLSLGLVWSVLVGARSMRGVSYLASGLSMVVLLLPPWVYVSARCRHDIARLGDYSEQKRFGEAQILVRGLLVLDAHQQWRGFAMPIVAADLERSVRMLEARVAVPLAPDATARDKLHRAGDLAMLGRNEAALGMLQSVPDTLAGPEFDSLRGTIYETRSEWEPALASYRSAKANWEAQPPSSARTAGIVQATTGIAYCLRKSGRYAEAETSYQQLLELSPTADAHFLLAQFYDDAQQADKAREHTRRAMALAPDRYQQRGEKLINKLAEYHFGCLSVFSAETANGRR
jgi:hypothetical protein